MRTQRTIRFAFVPLTALAFLGALFFFVAGGPTPALAAGVPDWQQMHGNKPMTDTMPMTETKPAMMDHPMYQGQGMMGQGMMRHEQAGMGDQMVSIGHRMQMMGMMMQMMGHMQKMTDQMQSMMGEDMSMMHGPMAYRMPMTHTMPMNGSMGMMGMDPMDKMMGHMMGMMEEMQQMHKMMNMDMMGMGMMGTDMMGMGSAPTHTMPMTNTVPPADTTSMTRPDLTQTAQVGSVEIVVTAVNLHDAEADTLDFTIALNSHTTAIDLDLAKTAMLHIGDAALSPTAWETASPKGHHIKGLLRFPRTAEDGSVLLADATEISLMIGGLPNDVEHTFTWEAHSH